LFDLVISASSRTLNSSFTSDLFSSSRGQTFAFIAVILDCVDDRAKAFYQRWDFAELPGNPYRLFLSAKTLAAMMSRR